MTPLMIWKRCVKAFLVGAVPASSATNEMNERGLALRNEGELTPHLNDSIVRNLDVCCLQKEVEKLK